MDLLKSFVITLVTTIIFMTAVELIGPDNSMKKYLKFILGLLLISVILTPIVAILTKGEGEITEEIVKYQESIFASKETDEKSTSDTNIKEEQFKENFNKNCENLLKKEYEDLKFTCKLDCKVNFDSMTFVVNELKVLIVDKSIKSVKKVEIGEKDEGKNKEDDKQREIKEFLAKELKIDKDKIKVEYAK